MNTPRSARAAAWVLHHPRAALLLALGLALLAVAVTFPLRVDGDMLSLVSATDPYAVSLREARRAPGGEGQIVVSFPEGVDLDEAAARLEALDSVRATFHALDPTLTAKRQQEAEARVMREANAKRLAEVKAAMLEAEARAELESQGIRDLKKVASTLGVKRYGTMKKAELVEAILAEQAAIAALID